MALDIHIHLPIGEIEKLSMINNKVLIEVFDTRNRTKSGIELPITEDNPFIPDRGVIFSVPKDTFCFDVGDCVIISPYKGKRILSYDKRQFILLDLEYILCKIVDDADSLLSYADLEANQPLLQSAT